MIDQIESKEPGKSKESIKINKPPKSLIESTSGFKQFETSLTNLVTPFPNRLRSNKHSVLIDQILKMFKQVKVNIPLLDIIQQVSTYVKFLKDYAQRRRSTFLKKPS